ncbi:MAG: hypothetical protein H0W92_05875 [Sphingomonas sp.]|nr:hypothetical protein [Sphingomonas sp.]
MVVSRQSEATNDFDIAGIGGGINGGGINGCGINGCGIARDAAGRGAREGPGWRPIAGPA